MKKTDAVAILAALAQDNRLDVYRLLVQAGPEGMPAGEVADALGIAPNTLTFHFGRLRMAGLVSVRRDFQLPTIFAPERAPSSISLRRDSPRHMTMFPGAASPARAR